MSYFYISYIQLGFTLASPTGKGELILDQDSYFKHTGHIVRETSVMPEEARYLPNFIHLHKQLKLLC